MCKFHILPKCENLSQAIDCMSKYMLYFVVFVIIIVNGGSGLSG